jgi:hypothetical protein
MTNANVTTFSTCFLSSRTAACIQSLTEVTATIWWMLRWSRSLAWPRGFYSFEALVHQHRVLHQSSLPYLSEDRDSSSYHWQILDAELFRRFPLTPMEFGLKPKSLVSLWNYLSIHMWIVKKWSLYVTWASILPQTAPGVRDGLELDLDDLAGLLRRWPRRGRPRDFLVCSPSPWGVLQLGLGSQDE